jgi:hypothetical protein
MGLWDKIRDKILPPRKEQPVDDIAKPDPYGLPDMSSLQPSDTGTATTTAPTTTAAVDVEQVLEARLAEKGNPDLDWRTSIVDLMKLLDIDSSLDNRKELADELGYTGDKDGSAEMNIWLHKEVMRQLAANGGTVPAGLAD